MEKKNKRLIFWLILFILIIIISFWGFNKKIEIEYYNTSETDYFLEIPSDYFTKPSFFNMLRGLVGLPLDIGYYNIIFKDNSYFEDFDEGYAGDLSWSITMDNKHISVPYGDKVQILSFKSDKPYKSHIQLVLEICEDKKNEFLYFDPNIDIYAKVPVYEYFPKIILFIFEVMGLLLLISSFWNKFIIKKK
ncbi:MAG: hypothetical protein ABIJ18_04950 [archaeon]